MKFSVLVPVYNVKPYLADCLDSIVNQGYEDMELIVVNDGSTDGSGGICREYEKRFPGRLRLIEQRNRGLLLARRAAIDVAQGDYLIFVDSDDALRAGALQVIDRLLSRTDVDVLLFQASRSPLFDVPYFNHEGLYKDMVDGEFVPKETMRKQLALTHNVNSMCAKAIRRDCIDQGSDYEEYEGLQYGEDLLQMCPIFNKAKSFAISSEILYFYRDNGASISHHVNASRLDDIRRVRTRLASYVEKWDSALLPFVYANDCVEVFVYCVLCANRYDFLKASEAIDHARGFEFFRNSSAQGDLSQIALWKRVGVRLLQKGSIRFFIVIYHTLFLILRALKSGIAARYL